jgi:hypothetical protein
VTTAGATRFDSTFPAVLTRHTGVASPAPLFVGRILRFSDAQDPVASHEKHERQRDDRKTKNSRPRFF